MKILIDMSFVRPYELTKSIPLYGFRLLQGFHELHVNDVSLLVNADLQNYYQTTFPLFHTIPVRIRPCWRRINWRVKDWLFDLAYRWKISHISYDVVLTLNELNQRTAFRTRKKKISVIHDLKDLSLKKDKELIRSRAFYRQLIDSADAIVAISEYTRQDILSQYDVKSDKIRVIYNSIKMTEKSIRPQPLQDERTYILYVNTLKEYKNPLILLQAFNEIKDIIKEDIVLVGRATEYWYDVLLPYIKNNGIEHRVIRFQDISDEELKYLYEHASLFVSSSQHEGFGFTPIEAAICCCPVICTKCEALPETTMMLLNYYEPADDYRELANKIIEVLKSPRNNSSLLTISEKYQQKYTPKAQASQFLSLMEGLLREG